jgi:hypothetical protein
MELQKVETNEMNNKREAVFYTLMIGFIISMILCLSTSLNL